MGLTWCSLLDVVFVDLVRVLYVVFVGRKGEMWGGGEGLIDHACGCEMVHEAGLDPERLGKRVR